MKYKILYYLYVFLLFLCPTALLTTACSSTPTKTQSELENLQFMDTKIFDENLLKSMTTDTENITVTMIGGISINHIPERLGKWLSIVMDRQGSVNFEKATQASNSVNAERTTGVEPISLLVGVLPTAYNFLIKEASYGVAGNYNATVYYQPATGSIKKIVFSRKTTPKG